MYYVFFSKKTNHDNFLNTVSLHVSIAIINSRFPKELSSYVFNISNLNNNKLECQKWWRQGVYSWIIHELTNLEVWGTLECLVLYWLLFIICFCCCCCFLIVFPVHYCSRVSVTMNNSLTSGHEFTYSSK